MPFALSPITLTSTDFAPDGVIPRDCTGEGADRSPALNWTLVPEGTQSFAIICHDPDAPLVSSNGRYGFVHWVLYNLPATVSELAAGTDLGTPGQNNFGGSGYAGPMPPEGHGTHRYYFWVLALDSDEHHSPDLTLWQFLEKVEPNIIGMNRLVGTYRREG
jgi:Raf kinase inhibitor-like YbhB/YbcL family protein